MKTISPASQTPFTDLMLHPDKLEAALKAARRENEAFEASRKYGRSRGHDPQPQPRRKTSAVQPAPADHTANQR